MASKFERFVESCTDSRYIPLGACCDLCGEKLGFLRTGFWSINAAKLPDGVLCEACFEKAKRLLASKRKWMKAGALSQSSWGGYNAKGITTMPLQAVREMMADKGKADQARLASFGEGVTCLFAISDAIRIEPTALQVGAVRARRLKNKVVVYGTVACGSFSRRDVVHMEGREGRQGMTILEAYVRGNAESDIDINLRAHMGKHRLNEGDTGWLVLDDEEDVDADKCLFR